MKNSRRRWWFAGCVGLLLGAGGGVVARSYLSRGGEDAARARALLDEAKGILATSGQENLVALAPAAFAAAESGVVAAEDLLRAGHAAAAVPASASAVSQARLAREEALGKVTVSRAARLKSIRNQVLHRSAEAVDWVNADLKMNLFDRDRIATKERSEAVVEFSEGNEMRVEENSVMVVERLTENQVKPSVSMTLKVEQGNVRSAISRQDNHDVRLEINLPRADVVIDTARSRDGRAEIATRVHPDHTNRVAVYTGEAEVVSPGGEKVVVRQNQYAEVSAEGRVSAPRELPTAAITLLPGRDATVYVSSQRPEVTFKWKAAGGCSGYRLEVARDREFLDKLVDEKLTRTSFTYGNLKPGQYLWRLSCLDDKGTEGAHAETSTFAVVVDNDAPRLKVLSPVANSAVGTGEVEARCKTEPGVAVFINGQEATRLGDGEYARTVTLAPGLNTLVFEAVDAAGNVIYNSLLVTRR